MPVGNLGSVLVLPSILIRRCFMMVSTSFMLSAYFRRFLRKSPTGRLSPCLWGPELGFTVNTPPSLPNIHDLGAANLFRCFLGPRGSSLWQTLCERPPWRLSKEGSVAQLERWRGGRTDWRQVFVERFKLRRAWLGGQCHVRTFEGHTGGISCVQFDGSRIVSGSHDKTIKVWDLSISVNWSSIACRVTMVGHTDTVRCVQMDQARDRVISGSYDTTLKVWELKTGICIKTLRGHSAPVLA